MIALVACATAGCSANDPSAASREAEVQSFQSASLVVPNFTGPYTDLMSEYYVKSESSFFREVISDERVTDEEYREAQERAKKCLVDLGFTGIAYFLDGGSRVDDRTDISDEEETALHDRCEWITGFGETEIWYGMLRRNPDNVDWPAAERDCLVRAGLLAEGTTVEEMNRWYDSLGEGRRSQHSRASAPGTHWGTSRRAVASGFARSRHLRLV